MFVENISNGSHTVGDVVIIQQGGDRKTAKIRKVCSDNSYIVNIKDNLMFGNTPVAITGDDIIMQVYSNAEDDATKNWAKVRSEVISNDLTTTNYPGNDGGGNGVYATT